MVGTEFSQAGGWSRRATVGPLKSIQNHARLKKGTHRLTDDAARPAQKLLRPTQGPLGLTEDPFPSKASNLRSKAGLLRTTESHQVRATYTDRARSQVDSHHTRLS